MRALNISATLQLDTEAIAALQLQSLRTAHGDDGCHPQPAEHRPSVGYFHPALPTALAICGSAAEQWLQATPEAAAQLSNLSACGVQTLLLAANASRCPKFHDAAVKNFRGRLLVSPLSESRLVSALWSLALDQRPPTTVHGVLLHIYGLGVLLTGASGVGKSELALELVSRGHHLVADDAVELRRAGPACLIGQSPSLLRGFIEARGLGILDAGALYGAAAIATQARLDLIFELDGQPGAAPTDDPAYRLHGARACTSLLGTRLPMMPLRRRLGHNLAVFVEAGCRDHWLRVAGYRADNVFIERQQRLISVAGPDIKQPPDPNAL